MAGKYEREFEEEEMGRLEKSRRGYWGNKAEFILASFGNVWGATSWVRFPYLCYKFGGMPVFLIAYMVMLSHIGIPMMLLEMYLGQYSSQGVLTVWRLCPLFKGIGVSILLYGCVLLSYHAQYISWAFHYFIVSFTQSWFDCHNHWNTPSCGDRNMLPPNSPNATYDEYAYSMREHYAISPVEEYYKNVFRDESADPDFAIGSMVWKRILCLAVLWVATALILCLGARSLGKVVYFTSTLPFLLLIVFLIRSLNLPGALDGIGYLISPNFNRLLEINIWTAAASEVIFGLGIGIGSHLTLASYNRFQNNYVLDTTIIVFVHLLTRVLCAVIIFGFVGFLAHQLGASVNDVVTTGPRLIYVVIPDALSRIPATPAWCFFFFLMTFIMSFSAMLPVMEMVCAGICDLWRPLLKLRFVLVGILSSAFFLVGILFCTSAGQHMFNSLDLHLHPMFNAVIICAMCSCAIFYTICRTWHDLKLMLGDRHFCFVIMTFLIALPACLHWFFLPITSILYLVISAMEYMAPPSLIPWTIYVGWATLGLILLPLVLWPIIIFIMSCCRGCRCFPVFCPESKWGPHLSRFRVRATHLPHINVSPLTAEGVKLEHMAPIARYDM